MCQFTNGSNATGCQIDTLNNGNIVSYTIERDGHHLTVIKFYEPLFENGTIWKAFGLKHNTITSTEPAFTGLIIFPPQPQSKLLNLL